MFTRPVPGACYTSALSPQLTTMQLRSPGTVCFGPYEVRLSTRELFRHGVRVKLPPQAFEVLRVLLERNGELITRQEFHRVLWPADTFVDFDQGLNNAIKRIREVLNDSADSPRYVETLPRLGYRFIGQVDPPQPGFVDRAITNNGAQAPAVPEPKATSPPARRTPRHRSKCRLGPPSIGGWRPICWQPLRESHCWPLPGSFVPVIPRRTLPAKGS